MSNHHSQRWYWDPLTDERSGHDVKHVAGVVLSSHTKRTDSKIPNQITQDVSQNFISHFFTEYLIRNDFASGSLDLDAIISNFQISPSLYYVLLAVGALDMSKNPLSSPAARKSATTAALTSYQKSISSFRTDLQLTKLTQNDAALWTTFFLGIFELMCDISGEGWVKHILHGTSQILKARGPGAHLEGRGRSVWNVIDPTASLPKKIELVELAAEGLLIRTSLEAWHLNFQADIEKDPISKQDPWIILASTYYHSISIYLSGIFEYRTQFNHSASPTLCPSQIQNHVNAILSNAELALRTTRLVGILFFFPLRVAGARAKTIGQRSKILRMLGDISKRSFVVADAFVADLDGVWEERG
ncbi:hypothetical protein GLAREA_06635 [Glarea lozoyensis ATCC 20868]|uniref:Transcription factor domain-containing protein n=1 Tax=Glarea lozoyensis (strain ATCC 20868 / MF5171) TaxID=1116229 RepID=S3D579_GLAL2|nr:uncharacterized protein GLAREA_06635 [Glarea lozoyensis ATCC 20868]EPE33622.1 hypothetical protein GLAREA_06635 [Glarea lozoyensis ATCC 20868]